MKSSDQVLQRRIDKLIEVINNWSLTNTVEQSWVNVYHYDENQSKRTFIGADLSDVCVFLDWFYRALKATRTI